MPHRRKRSRLFGNGLFWRTFLLLTFLITASVVAWLASFRMFERVPRAEQIAAQITSVVTLTRAALVHSAPEMRRELLFDLASNEGIRIYPLESKDKIVPLNVAPVYPELETIIQHTLAKDTLFAASVNDVEGFWVSFKIDKDDYWLMLDRTRLQQTSSSQWLRWGPIALLLSLIGAAFISALINQPLARLTAAARAVAKGDHPAPLPESGPTEVEEANRSFNQMVNDLERIESDRTVILAGISHDLRTPLARMQLEIEMAPLSEEAREGMRMDLTQMDAIIGQFTNYAKPRSDVPFAPLDLSALLKDAIVMMNRLPDVTIHEDIDKNITINGNQTDLERVLNNLVENANRYGKTPETGKLELEISCHIEGQFAVMRFSDHGEGAPESELNHMLLPFTRLDSARSQANGSGLGLAIVNRIVSRHGARLSLYNRVSGGLTFQIAFPLLPARKSGKHE